MDSYVYAVGGYDSSCQLRSVERYSLEKDVWEFVAPMNSPRSALSVAVVCNRLYALGEILMFSNGYKTDSRNLMSTNIVV
jgi:hypothetical protein